VEQLVDYSVMTEVDSISVIPHLENRKCMHAIG